MFGFPWDTRETHRQMVKLRARVGAQNNSFNFPSAYPGTPLYNEMRKLNLINEHRLDYEDFSWTKLPLAETLCLTKMELKELMPKLEEMVA